MTACHTYLTVRAHHRLDGSVEDSHPGSLLTGCHSGSLSDHEHVRGGLGLER